MFILHNDLSASSAHTIGVVSFAWPRYIGCWLWTSHCSGYFFRGYLFLPRLLTRYWFVLCQQHMCHRFCVLCIYGVLADFEQVVVLLLLYLALFVNYTLFVINVTSTCTLGLSCSIILVQWLLLWTSHRFNAFIFHLGTVYFSF